MKIVGCGSKVRAVWRADRRRRDTGGRHRHCYLAGEARPVGSSEPEVPLQAPVGGTPKVRVAVRQVRRSDAGRWTGCDSQARRLALCSPPPCRNCQTRCPRPRSCCRRRMDPRPSIPRGRRPTTDPDRRAGWPSSSVPRCRLRRCQSPRPRSYRLGLPRPPWPSCRRYLPMLTSFRPPPSTGSDRASFQSLVCHHAGRDRRAKAKRPARCHHGPRVFRLAQFIGNCSVTGPRSRLRCRSPYGASRCRDRDDLHRARQRASSDDEVPAV